MIFRGDNCRYVIAMIAMLLVMWVTLVATDDIKCSAVADITLILASSSDITPDKFEKMKMFAATLTRSFPVGPDNTQFSVIVYSNSAERQIDFNGYSTNNDLYQAILNVRYTPGSTNTAAALRLATESAYNPNTGARPFVGKVVIVFTVFHSNNAPQAAINAHTLQQSGAVVIVVAVERRVTKQDWLAIASDPSLVFEVGSFSELDVISDELLAAACTKARQTMACITDSCVGKLNDNYPACSPQCKAGYFYNCENYLARRMECPLAYYTFNNGTRFTARTVFDRRLNSCQLQVSSCPRDPQDYVVPS